MVRGGGGGGGEESADGAVVVADFSLLRQYGTICSYGVDWVAGPGSWNWILLQRRASVQCGRVLVRCGAVQLGKLELPSTEREYLHVWRSQARQSSCPHASYVRDAIGPKGLASCGGG